MPDEVVQPESSPAQQEVAAPEAVGIFDPEPAETPAPAEQSAESAPAETTEPEGETKEEQPEGESVSAPEAAKRPEGKAEARIRQLTAKVREMERRLQETGQAPAPKQQAAQAPAKPKLDQFETIEQYDAAIEKWKDDSVKYEASIAVERERRQMAIRAQQEAAARREREIAGNWQKRVEKLAPIFPDLKDALKDGADGLIPRNATIDGFILDSEHGPAILHELWKNPDEAERIAAMSPYACVRAMHTLEMKVAARVKGINPRPSTVTPPRQAAGRPASPSKPKTAAEILYG